MQYMRCDQVGGNAKCKQFFRKHGIPDTMSIADRYHTEVAESYKAKIKSLVTGTSYQEPAPGSLSTIPNRPPSRIVTPTSPGGPNKYSGMGNYTPPPKQKQNASDWSSYLSVGLSSLQAAASVAAETTTQYAKTAAERLSETSSALQERAGQTNWSDKLSSLGSTVTETSNTGWSTLSTYWQNAKEGSNGPNEQGDQTAQRSSQGGYGATRGNERMPQKSANLPAPEQQLAQGWVSVPLTNEKEEKKESDGWDQWDDETNRSSQRKAFDGWGGAPESDDDSDDNVPAIEGDGDGWAVDPDN